MYGYGISSNKNYDFGDKKVNYFENGFNSLINFDFKYDAQKDYEFIFSKYNDKLKNTLQGFGVLNYLSSHDDGSPFDQKRSKSYESAIKLLLSPGTSQVYYGDESDRSLIIKGTVGDATLRSNMNWSAIDTNNDTQAILLHWQKLGQFRRNHPAIGAGTHQMITEKPYTFYRSFSKGNFKDEVVVGLDLPKGKKELSVRFIFKDGDELIDAYSGKEVKVKNGKVIIDSEFDIVLLEKNN